jgi:hypothetical protein
MSNNRSDPVLFFRGTVVDMKDNKAPDHLNSAGYKMLKLKFDDWKYIAKKEHTKETILAKFKELTGAVEPPQPVQQRSTNEVFQPIMPFINPPFDNYQNLIPQVIGQHILQQVPVDVQIDFLKQKLFECQQELCNETQKCLDLEKQLQQVLALNQPDKVVNTQPTCQQQDESYPLWFSSNEVCLHYFFFCSALSLIHSEFFIR